MLSFATCERTKYKQAGREGEKVGKISLLKDINIEKPHTGHVKILDDLKVEPDVTTFDALYKQWQEVFNVQLLNKKFYQELANWYFWALRNVEFPEDAEKNKDVRNAISVIRMITRLIFIWFVKEKGLIHDDLFNQVKLKSLLNFSDKNQSTYYKAILQNLFFATLNTEMNKDKPGSRKFRGKRQEGRDQHYMIHNVFRYEDYFTSPQDTLKNYFENIPFLNGGLFECLDKEIVGATGSVAQSGRGTASPLQKQKIRIDGFSDRKDNPLKVPDYLFFSSEQAVDLNEIYGTKNKTYKVRGLIDILDSYKFTVDENTPIEEEIALDPELLGKVFENLLASYNPETQTTARKQTGSFYTPREIVNYMVDESIIAYLSSKLPSPPAGEGKGEGDNESRLRHLVAYNDDPHKFTPTEVDVLIAAINALKALDPACGSGAFPMGMLHKLVYILGKLDPDNSKWRELQKQKAIKETEEAYKIGDKEEREKRLLDISEVFENNASDYGRKLYLIENCIFGVDIQPIAVQIAKLRFFVSLIVDQRIDPKKENLGVRPLPNLETKFVAANTLIGIEKPEQLLLRNPEIDRKEKELKEVRERHFTARTPQTKEKYRKADERLRAEISELLENDGFPRETTEKLSKWNPYDQNSSADFFDSEWMFGVTDGFDVVIGNPPYVSANNMSIHERSYFNKVSYYKTLKGKWDLYVAFTEKSLKILSSNGAFTFIIPFGFLNQPFAEEIRKFVLNEYSLQSIVDLHNNKIFESATVPSCIPLIQKKQSLNHQVNILEFKEGDFLIKYKIDILKYHSTNQHMFRTEDLNQKADLLQKIKEGGDPLESEFYVSTGAEIHGKESRAKDGTTISGTSKFDVLHKVFSKGLKPYIEGSDIPKSKGGRYSYPEIETWLDYSKPEDMRSPKFKELFDSEKLIVRGSSGLLRILAIYDDRKIYTSHKCTLIIHRSGLSKTHSQYQINITLDLKYLLAVLNSRVIDFYYESVYGGFIDVYPNNLKELPIRKASSKTQCLIKNLVDQILTAKKKDPNADTSALEKQIDEMVYALYGLTPEEIAIVEGKG
ncbi:MAG: hypothetical protein C4550_07155 [Nitrospiraceae bacterium]|nr:MAG: hypothetical protein C4550_07155 [Nitrospiraceae bacterium]